MLRMSLFAALFFGMILLPAFGSGETDITVRSTNEQGCEFVFTPQHFSMNPVTMNGTEYVRADFDHASADGNSGDPNLPVRTVIIGLPPEGGVNIQVTTGPVETTDEIRILPIPGIRREGNMPIDVYEEGEAYRKREILPGRFWEAGDPEVLSEQRVLRILLYPLQYDPASDRIHWCPQMTIRIDFETPGKTGTMFRPAANERLYRSVLLNYETAKSWRILQSPSLSKLSWTFGPGPWYTIPVTEEGVYKVTGTFLRDNGVDIDQIDPAVLKVYNNGGRMVPRNFDLDRQQALIETPIILFGMEDGSFDADDYFLFYGKGVTGWEYDSNKRTFSHYGNLYTDTNIYWLTYGDGVAGKRIESQSRQTEGVSPTAVFWDQLFYEQDIYNPYTGGIHWLGQVFSRDIPSRSFDVTLTDLAATDSVLFRLRTWSESSNNQYTIRWNQTVVRQFNFGDRYQSGEAFVSGAAVSGQNTLALEFYNSNKLTESYLDWYEVFYLRNLNVVNQRLIFSSPTHPGLYRYQVSNLAADGMILDVTDPSQIRKMTLSDVSGKKEFTDQNEETPHVYYAIEPAAYLAPGSIEKHTLQNLRNVQNGADLVIISHADFYDEAERLKAHKESFSGLNVYLADIQNVFDEFSWGLYDPTAIRDFMRYAWENWSKRPAYLLLVGDGDYDYRNILGKNDKNWIPPYEESGYATENSEEGIRATDDWYVMVAGSDDLPDLAVGRLPVQTQAQARTVVDKIIQYEAEPVRGPWRNLITLVGDDEITPRPAAEWTHMEATLALANSVIPPCYNIKPIYLPDYPTEVLFDRRRKPKAQEDLINQFNRGTVFVNYSGHANEDLWADEWVFVRSEDLQKLENKDLLPVVYAATCSFSQYDNYQKSSFGEDLVLLDGGGAVAVIAASRDCNATSNNELNRFFFEQAFSESEGSPRLGDALLSAKMQRGTRSAANDEMYHILGDPTLVLATPQYRAVFTDVSPDSFMALHVQTASGTIQKEGSDWSEFQGTLALQAFDSQHETTYIMKNGTPKTYSLPGNALYRGETRVENGQFDIAFVVPKDITYGSSSGRLSGYFYNDQADGSVFFNNIPIGGSELIEDEEGPTLAIYFEGHDPFISGGLVSQNPKLGVVIADDKTGINITGDIGHKIQLTVDGNDPLDVTDYFQYDEGSYLAGRLTYPLTDLSAGRHTLSLKAWDNANNSATQSIEFQIVPAGEIRIEEVLSYPNPMDDATDFTFQLNRDAEIDIKIYTVSGRQIRHLSRLWGQPGFNMIPWNGRDEAGDAIANGVYLYKITARAQDGDKTAKDSEIGRLMVIHR